MKNFTQRMKNVLFGVLAIFAMAAPAKAEVNGISDLFGKYKFTATIEYTEAGQAYKGQFKESSDVTIERHDIYDGQIIGLAGSKNGQLINGWNADKKELIITNPSQGSVWGDLYMTNPKGDYPFHGILEGHEDAYSTAYAYNAADGSIAIPDFTLGKGDYQAETFTVYVKFSNVKLELVELEKVDIVDLSGDWHYTAGKGPWDSMEGSTLPKEFDMTLVAKNEQKTSYTATFIYGDFAPVDIDAEFNGSVFSLNLDSTALDVNERVYLICSYSNNPYRDQVTFNYTKGGSLNISSGLTIVRCDSIAPEKPKAQLQWFQSGVAKRQGGEVSKLTWDGTFKMTAEKVYNIAEGANYPETFDLKVEKGDYGYYISEIVGYKLNPNAMMLNVDETNPLKAKIALDYYGMRILEMVDPGKVYIVLGDQNASVDGDINLTLNEDGSMQMGNIAILRLYYGTDKNPDVLGSYVGLKGQQEAKPEVPEFSWVQTFKVTADVDVYNKNYEYPESFNMTVVANEYTGGVMLTEFFGGDISMLNNGGAQFTVDESDSMKASIAGGATLKTVEPGKFYFVLGDMNAQFNPINVTADAEGNLTFDNFSILLQNFETKTTTTAAYYKNVKATLVATGIEGVLGETANVWGGKGVVYMDKAQPVQVYDYAGKCIFKGETAQVRGLVKGIYLVKTDISVVKVLVR